MNNLGRTLLYLGVVVLALLIGVLIGRTQRTSPAAPEGNASVQISTAAPAAPPPAQPLPAPVQAPQPAAPAPPRIAPDAQVQDDAAAVGMTTREPSDAPDATNGGATRNSGEAAQTEPVG